MSAKKLLRAEKNLLQPAVRLRAEKIARTFGEFLFVFFKVDQFVHRFHGVFVQFSENFKLSLHVLAP